MKRRNVIHPTQLAAAVAALRRGDLVAFPTETVYGLGANGSDPEAVRRIFAAKGRPADHPVIVHVRDADMAWQWASDVPDAARTLAAQFWPGPLTLILPRALHVSDVVTGGQGSVGLRVPDHPVARALLQAFGGGIAAPSANRFGRISPTRAEHVRAELGDAVAMVLGGEPPRVGVESTIVALTGREPVLLRPGSITVAQIEAALHQPIARTQRDAPRASGTLPSHYAPATPLQLVAPDELAATVAALSHAGQRVAVLARQPAPLPLHELPWIVAPPDAASYAHDLYANLRALDALRCDRIVVEAVPTDEAWHAVADRLRRAAHTEK
jgi:L-threonylcarbamoyladenylate synthase